MAIAYDDYQYVLSSTSPVHSVILPKDVFWENELSWSPISQDIQYSTTGALLMQEGVKLKGREITLAGKDDMAWITREIGAALVTMRNTPELVMTLKFQHKTDLNLVLFSHTVRFLQTGNALNLALVKDFDQYEVGAWYIIRTIQLIEVA